MLLALASYSACSRSSSDKRMVKFFLGSINCPLRPISNPFFRFFFIIRHWKFPLGYPVSKTCVERIRQIRILYHKMLLVRGNLPLKPPNTPFGCQKYPKMSKWCDIASLWCDISADKLPCIFKTKEFFINLWTTKKPSRNWYASLKTGDISKYHLAFHCL